jgi:hypothetical protein
MKLKVVAVLLLLLSCTAARAQDKPVELKDGFLTINFTPPKETKRLDAEETAGLLPSGSGLKVAFGNPAAGMLLTINTFDAASSGLPIDATENSRNALQRKLESDVTTVFATVEWTSRGTIETDGPRWVRLLCKVTNKNGSRAVLDTYAITWFGRVVVFNYLGLVENYEQQRKEFEKSAASIVLTIAATPVMPEAKPRKPRRRKP